MRVLMLGISYQSAPVDVRGRVAFSSSALPSDLRALIEQPEILEGLILSTCNRTEIYAVVSDGARARASLTEFVLAHKPISRQELEHHVVWREQDAAIEHLFRVSAGLESQIMGEGQVLAQLKDALCVAQATRTSGAVLDALFRCALSAGKRARSRTAISRGAVSTSAAAIELARERLGALTGRSILILGAGKIGEHAARQLGGMGLGALYIANRTLSDAAQLAERLGGKAIAFHELSTVLSGLDVLLCCTGAPHHVLTAADLTPVVAGREARPLVLFDMAVPRNLDPAIRDLPGCVLHDLDDLQAIASRHRSERANLVPAVEALLAEERASFQAWLKNYRLSPTITSLRGKVQEIRELALERFWQRHGARFDDEQQRLVSDLIAGLMDKVLHGPLSRLKDTQVPEQRQLTRALETLFDLSVEDIEDHHRRRLTERRMTAP